jgi:hypothetical protein
MQTEALALGIVNQSWQPGGKPTTSHRNGCLQSTTRHPHIHQASMIPFVHFLLDKQRMHVHSLISEAALSHENANHLECLQIRIGEATCFHRRPR